MMKGSMMTLPSSKKSFGSKPKLTKADEFLTALGNGDDTPLELTLGQMIDLTFGAMLETFDVMYEHSEKMSVKIEQLNKTVDTLGKRVEVLVGLLDQSKLNQEDVE